MSSQQILVGKVGMDCMESQTNRTKNMVASLTLSVASAGWIWSSILSSPGPTIKFLVSRFWASFEPDPQWKDPQMRILNHHVNMDVSKNSGTPKSSILIGFSIINHPFWGTPIVGNTHIASQVLVRANHLQQSFEQRFSLQMRLVTGFTSMHLGDKCVWNHGFP